MSIFKKLAKYSVVIFVVLLVQILLLFTIFDAVPALNPYLAKLGINYYSLRELYSYDPELAIMMKPHRSDGGRYLAPEAKAHPVLSKFHSNVKFFSTFNEYGLRPNSKTADPQVVFIGDSFTQCGERDDNTLSELVASKSKFSTTNLGVSWHGPPQYLAMLKRHGLKKKPKVVIFGFFEGNDVRDILAYEEFKKTGRYYDFDLRDGSYWYRLGQFNTGLNKRISKIFHQWVRVPIAKLRGRYTGGALEQVADVKVAGKHYKMGFIYRGDQRSPEDLLEDSGWKTLESYLKELIELSKQHDFVPLVMNIPTAIHIYAELTNLDSGKAWLKERELQIKIAENRQKAFETLSERLGLQRVDLVQQFKQQAQQGVMLYYPFDGHWSLAGRELAADLVVQKLNDLNLAS